MGAAFAFVGFVGFLESRLPALGALRVEVGELAFHHLAGEILCLVHDLLGEAANLVHELRTRHAAAFHLLEFELPFTGHLRRGERIGPQSAQEADERKSFLRDNEFPALAVEVTIEDQSLDDLRPGGGGAEAAQAHGIAQFLVIDQLAGTLHGGQKCGLGKTGRRLRFAFLDLDVLGFCGLARNDRAKRLLVLTSGLLAIDRQPARIDDDLPVALEGFVLHPGDAGGDFELGGGIKDRHKALRHHVENLQLEIIEPLGRNPGGNDGVVVTHPRIVKNTFVRLHPTLRQGLAGMFEQVGVLKFGEGRLDVADVVLRQVTRIGSRIGQHLVLFVKRLGDLQGAFGTEGKAGVGFALQRGQIVQQGRRLGGGFPLLLDDSGFARALGHDGLGLGFVPDALGLGVLFRTLFEFLVQPASAVTSRRHAEIAEDLKIRARLKLADLRFAFGQNGQRWCLHPAHRGELKATPLGIEGGHGPCAVDSDQPVAFAAADGCVGQGLHFLAVAQLGETGLDRLRRHALQPEAAGRLLYAGEFEQVIKNQFPFAPGVTGIDDLRDIGAFELALDQLEPALILLDRLEVEVIGNDGQVGETPFAALFVHLAGQAEFDQMADGRGDDILVVLKDIVLLGNFSEGAGQVGRDAGLFGNDESFGHFGLLDFHKTAAGQLLDQPPHFKGEQRRRDLVGWQPAFGNDRVESRLLLANRIAHSLFRPAERHAGGGRFELHSFPEKQSEVIENILRAHDQFGPLLDEAVGSDGGGIVDPPGNDVKRTPLFCRLIRTDQGSALGPGLHHEQSEGQAADDAVAHGKGLAVGLGLHGKLADDRPTACGDFFREGAVFRRIEIFQPAAEHRDRAPLGGERRLMRRCVNAAGQSAGHGEAGVSHLIGKFFGAVRRIMGGLASPHDPDGAGVERGGISPDVEHDRWIMNLAQDLRIIRIAPRHHLGPKGFHPLHLTSQVHFGLPCGDVFRNLRPDAGDTPQALRPGLQNRFRRTKRLQQFHHPHRSDAGEHVQRHKGFRFGHACCFSGFPGGRNPL